MSNTTQTIDLTGQTFGRLTVLHRMTPPCPPKAAWWTCRCECGHLTDVRSQSLRKGQTQSCGCFRRQRMTKMNTTHNMSRSPEYVAWVAIIQRCTNPLHSVFKDYGGRSITVCPEWSESFEAFYRDMGPRPSAKYSVERADNEKGYSPSNCRWATRREQALNRRTSHLLTVNGVTKTLMEWSRETGIPYLRLRKRVMTHKPLELIFKTSKIKPPGRPVKPQQ